MNFRKRGWLAAVGALALSTGVVVPLAMAQTPEDDGVSVSSTAEDGGSPATSDDGNVVTDDSGTGADTSTGETSSDGEEVPLSPVGNEPDGSDGTGSEEVPESSGTDSQQDDSLDPSQSEVTESDQLGLESRGVSLMSLTGVGCDYANAGNGEYKDTLCWLDLAGFTTEYGQTKSTSAQNQTKTVTCGIWPFTRDVTVYSSTATVTYDSVLNDNGTRYGVPVTGTNTSTSGSCSSSGSQAAANTAATSAADTAARAQLTQANSKVYGPISNYPISIDLVGGYTFTAALTVAATGGSNTAAGNAVTSSGFPTYGNAFLGNATSKFYQFADRDAEGKSVVRPAIYQQSGSGPNTTVTLSSIKLERGGTALTGYSIVVADAESTDPRESITWSTQGGSGFTWLPNKPTDFTAATTNAARKQAAVGNACTNTNATAWASLTAPTSPSCASGPDNTDKTGTAMLQVSPTEAGAATGFSVTQTMVGNGKQAVAFGILTAKANLTVNVADRIVDSAGNDSTADFTGSLTRSGDTFPISTGTTDMSATTGEQQFPVSSEGTQLSFASTVSGDFANSYQAQWSCTKSPKLTSTERWPGESGYSSTAPVSTDTWFKVLPGQFIDCKVNYVPPYLTVNKTVDNSELGTPLPSGVATAADWTVAASQQSASKISGTATTSKRPVAVGSYTLSETATSGSSANTAGYQLQSLTCSNDSTSSKDNQKVTIEKLNDVTCTYTNKAILPKLALVKVVDNANAGDSGLEASDWTVTAKSSPKTLSGNGAVSATSVVPGNFTLTESSTKSAAAGYEWSDLSCKYKDGTIFPITSTTTTGTVTGGSVTLTLADLGKEITCTYTNTAKAGSVTWQKTDASSPANYLSGSEWNLKGPGIEGSVTVKDCTSSPCSTDPNKDQDARAGYFEIKNLKWGVYTLTETKAPAGYEVSSQEHEFTISGDKLSANAGAIKNKQMDGPDLPLTGGMSASMFVLGGGGLLALALIGVGARGTRKGRHANQ